MATATLRAVGRYRLESLIGRGGMAEVYRALDSRLDRPVAVKMISPGLASRPNVIERFLREARLVAALEHPNILPIYDSGEEDGTPYLVMPLMGGGTLAERIGRSGLPAEIVADWVEQIADALDTAHTAGILHRDVKPGNVLMDRKERPVLADFGLARSVGAVSDVTRAGTMIGTPYYMAPELVRGRPATPSSDLYALGVLAYQMLSGTMPFEAETPVAVLHQHVVREIPRISQRVVGLPAELDRFFERALAKRPEDRFASGAELSGELSRCLGRVDPAAAAAPELGAPAASDALLDGSLLVTPVPDLPAVPLAVTPARVAPRGGWTVVFVALFAALGVLLGARSLLGKNASAPTRHVVPGNATGSASAPRGPEPLVPSLADAIDPLDGRPGSARRTRQIERPPRRLSASDFEALARRAATGLAAHPSDPRWLALASFASGGLAWMRGDEQSAREAAAAIERSGSEVAGRLPTWLALGGDPREHASWPLAALYANARGDGLSLVDARLAREPRDVRARTARALLLHLDGRHVDAVLAAASLIADMPAADGTARGHVLRFIGDERAELGQWDAALEAYRDAMRADRAVFDPATLDDEVFVSGMAGSADSLLDLFDAACAAGRDVACARAAKLRRRAGIRERALTRRDGLTP